MRERERGDLVKTKELNIWYQAERQPASWDQS